MVADAGRAGEQNLRAGGAPTPPLIDQPQPVRFFSIESDSPPRDFWVALARLLDVLHAAAWGRAVKAKERKRARG